MKLISIKEAESAVEAGELVFMVMNGWLNIVNKDRFNSIKNTDPEYLYDPKNPFNGIINTKDYYYSSGSDLAFMCNENIPSIKKFYKPDGSKNLYSLYIYDADDVYQPNKHTDIIYYETYDNMKNIFKDLMNKFMIAKYGSDISKIDESSVSRYDNEQICINEDYVFMNFSISELTGHITLYKDSDHIHNYVISFTINTLLEGE